MSSRLSPPSLARRQRFLRTNARRYPTDQVLSTFQMEFEHQFRPLLHLLWGTSTARMSALALERLGVAATVKFVKLRCLNAAAAEQVGRGPLRGAEQFAPFEHRFGFNPTKRWDENGFGGHLVVDLGDGRLFDGAIAQCRNPSRGLWTPTTILSSAGFFSSGAGCLVVPGAGFDALIEYSSDEPEPRVLQSPEWSHPAHQLAAAHLAASVEGRLVRQASRTA